MSPSPPTGLVSEIFIAGAMGNDMQSIPYAQAVENRGLVGDRYFLGIGTYSNHPKWGANVTLIQTEAVDAVNEGHETTFSPGELRRNLITTGVNLDDLIGVQFRCGTAVLMGTKPFPPCIRLARLVEREDVMKYFAYCAGIGATVISDGEIRPQDEIRILKA